MTLYNLFKNIRPFVKPYIGLIAFTLSLTLIGSFTAQINAIILKYTVDQINTLVVQGKGLNAGLHILIFISSVLLIKEVLNAFITFGQKFFGEKLKIYISRDFAQLIIDKILTYQMAFYTQDNNESGRL